MKKLLNLILASVLIGVTCGGCDPICSREFKIINQTEFDIVTKISYENGRTIIEPDKEQIVSHDTYECGNNGKAKDRYSEYPELENVKMLQAEMMIGEEPVTDVIWTRKYWTFVGKKGLAQYILIVTDELLNEVGYEN